MTPLDWVNAAVASEFPRDADWPPEGLTVEQAMAHIRFAYVTGYIDSLSGMNDTPDPCSAATALRLSLPVG